VVRGENGGTQLTTQLKADNPTPTFEADRVSHMNLILDRSNMPPDNYTGFVPLTMEGGVGRLEMPVDINVRTGPGWVFVYIVIGLALGQMVKIAEERKDNEDRTFLQRLRGESKGMELLLNVILFIGLVLVGVETLYVNQDLSLGANPLTDYLSLVLWGLSADVASRSLTKLRG
jgi:hypothetical protein